MVASYFRLILDVFLFFFPATHTDRGLHYCVKQASNATYFLDIECCRTYQVTWLGMQHNMETISVGIVTLAKYSAVTFIISWLAWEIYWSGLVICLSNCILNIFMINLFFGKWKFGSQSCNQILQNVFYLSKWFHIHVLLQLYHTDMAYISVIVLKKPLK